MRPLHAVSRFLPLLLAPLVAAGILACGPGPGSRPARTSQPVELVRQLRPGMSKAEVTQVMGEPIRSEFSWSTEAWHYCRTGKTADEFAVVVFVDDKVTQARNYTVTAADVGGATGDCPKFIRPVTQSVGPSPAWQ